MGFKGVAVFRPRVLGVSGFGGLYGSAVQACLALRVPQWPLQDFQVEGVHGSL